MTHPPGDPSGFKVLNEIGIVAQLSGNLFERQLPDGLSLAGFALLNNGVRLGDGKTPAELARAFQVSKATMTHTLQRLEARGLVEVRPDSRDGRSKRVHLTDAGRAVREAAIAALAPTLAELNEDFTPEELDGLLPTLSRLRAWFDARRAL